MKMQPIIVSEPAYTFVPRTAVTICVTNVRNPWLMRVYKTKDYPNKLNAINKKLVALNQRGVLDFNNSVNEPHSGDSVIVYSKLSQEVDLPFWWCRGVLGEFEPPSRLYTVFLVDHGICVELSREDFILVPKNLIPDEYLTKTIGVYDVLPSVMKINKAKQENTALVLDDWNESAINFTRELINASRSIYFNPVAMDDNHTEYGQLYLDINNEIVMLSKALIVNGFAVELSGDLLKLIENPNDVPASENGILYVKKENSPGENADSKTSLEKKEKQEILRTNVGRPRNAKTRMDDFQQKVLIYSSVKCRTINYVDDAKFPTGIHKAWNRVVNSSRPKKIQSYIWPAIKQGLNVVAIGGPQTGKTFGHSVAITGLLAAQKNIPSGNKPSALILCSASSEVFRVQSICSQLLLNYSHLKSVAAYNGKPERTLAAEIYNGCQILVSTPRFLVRFLQKNKGLLNLEMLRYLVIDNADVVLDKYYSAIAELFARHKIIANREKQDESTPILQIIMAAQLWTPSLRKMVFTLMNDVYICITSFVEATIFKAVCPKVCITNSENKAKKILNFLRNQESVLKTMIICTKAQEAEELNNFLRSHKKTFLAHEEMNLLHLKGLKEQWDACVYGLFPILICTDIVLSELNITDIDWLIHYSVTMESKTRFNYRFSTLMDNLQKEKPNCKVTVILDESNDLQFRSITETMLRMKVSISKEMLENIERISLTLDRNKKRYPICDNVKSLGFCPKKNSCTYRHCVLPEFDAPITSIRPGDKVKFMVLYVHDATHFSARVIEYCSPNAPNKTQLDSRDYMNVSIKMQEYYSNVENRKRSIDINVGDICTLEDSIDQFRRVQIINIGKQRWTSIEEAKDFDVRCIDSGITLHNISRNRLLSIPDELRTLPVHTVELFLTGLAPYDDEYNWNNCANEAVHDWFRENFYETSYAVGTVVLHLGNTIWVETLEIGAKIIGHPDLIVTSLKAELIEKDHAIPNTEHTQKLRNLCKLGGLTQIGDSDSDACSN